MTRSFGLLLVVVVAGGLAAGAALAAWQGAGEPPAAAVPATRTAAAPAPAVSEPAGGEGMRVQRAATLTGTITAVAPTSISLKTDAGDRTVHLSGETLFRRNVPATLADLKAGETALVTGESGAGGPLAARTIQIGQAGDGQRGPVQASGARRLSAATAASFSGRSRRPGPTV